MRLWRAKEPTGERFLVFKVCGHATLEGCRRELREALSDWIALRLRLGLPVPVVAGIDLNQLTQPV